MLLLFDVKDKQLRIVSGSEKSKSSLVVTDFIQTLDGNYQCVLTDYAHKKIIKRLVEELK